MGKILTDSARHKNTSSCHFQYRNSISGNVRHSHAVLNTSYTSAEVVMMDLELWQRV